MKLYSGPLSLFTAKVRIALAETGIAYDLVSAGNFGIAPPAESNVQRWFAAVAARPSVAAELQAMTAWMAAD